MGLEHEILSSEVRAAEAPPRTIVVGYDGSALSRAALTVAVRRATRRGRIIAVHAVDLAPANALVGVPLPTDVPADPGAMGRSILSEIGAEDTGGVPFDTLATIGPAAHSLVDVAREHDADEIVVGSRGHGRFRAMLGSVSHALVHDADRPVVVLTARAAERSTEPGEPGHLIVVGYDGSEDARAALDYARRHLEPGGCVLAVYAYHAPGEWLGSSYYDRALESRLARGEQLLAEIEPGPDVQTELIAASPAAALAELAASRDADEIVVGSRGVSMLRSALGSVAHAVLHDADRPVVIVPRPSG